MNDQIPKSSLNMLAPHFDGAKLDTGFRVLVDYHIETDTHIVRLDMLKSRVQMNIGFHVRRAGNTEAGDTELFMPPKYDGFSVMANSNDLILVLHEMADRLEQQIKEDVEKMKP